MVPLSSYGKPYQPEPGKVDPAIDMKTAVREQVNALDGAAYFKLFAELLKTNPPAAEDAPMLAKLAKIGIVPGQDFDAAKLEPAVAKGIAGAPKPAQDLIMGWLEGRHRRRRPEARERLAVHHQDRSLRHELPAARARHRDRPRRQPAAGRRLSDVRGAGRRQEVQRRRRSTSCASTRASCRR